MIAVVTKLIATTVGILVAVLPVADASSQGVTLVDYSGRWRVRVGNATGIMEIKQVSLGDSHFSGRLELNNHPTIQIEQDRGYWDGFTFVFFGVDEAGTTYKMDGFYCVWPASSPRWIIVNGAYIETLPQGSIVEHSYTYGPTEVRCPETLTSPDFPPTKAGSFHASAVLTK